MYKTVVARVDGRNVYDVYGTQLKAISNLEIIPGQSVYTDGKVIYGYRIFEAGIVPLMPPLVEVLRLLATWLFEARYEDPSGNYDYRAGLYAYFYWFRATDKEFDLQQDVMINIPSYTIPYWTARPAFFSDGTRFYSLRGNYHNGNLYADDKKQNGQLIPLSVSEKLLCGWSHSGVLFWQDGDYCETKQTMENKVYKELEKTGSYWDPDKGPVVFDPTQDDDPNNDSDPVIYQGAYVYYAQVDDVNYDPDNDYNQNPYPRYSLGSNHSDLKIIYGTLDGVQQIESVASVIQHIEREALDIAQTAQDASFPSGDSSNMYGGTQTPVVLFTRPYSNTPEYTGYSDFRENVAGFGGYGYPPADVDTAKGGSPNDKINFNTRGDYTDSEHERYAQYYQSDANDYRFVYRPHFTVNGDLQYILNVEIGIEFYLFDHEISDDNYEYYDPDGNGKDWWEPWALLYRGTWLITGNRKMEIYRYVDGAYGEVHEERYFDYAESFENGVVVSYDYGSSGSGHTITLFKDGYALQYPGTDVYEVIPYDNNTFFIRDISGSIYEYRHDSFNGIWALYGGGTYIPDSHCANDIDNSHCIADYTKLADFYNELLNVPYVT